MHDKDKNRDQARAQRRALADLTCAARKLATLFRATGQPVAAAELESARDDAERAFKVAQLRIGNSEVA